MRLTVRFTLAALLFAAPLSAAKKPVRWEAGHVVSQNLSSEQAGAYARPAGFGGTIAVPIYRSANVVVVDVGQFRYTWSELINRHPLILRVNTDVQFYRDKDWFIVLDAKGGKHKFSLVGSLQMPDSPK